jgi:hypothetical protein
MVKFTFETESETNQTFVHIESDSGILGHAKEVKRHVPIGTWLTIPVKYQPTLTKWMVKKCGFKLIARLSIDNEIHDVLIRDR